jgi:hypothetical protein
MVFAAFETPGHLLDLGLGAKRAVFRRSWFLLGCVGGGACEGAVAVRVSETEKLKNRIDRMGTPVRSSAFTVSSL